MSLSVMFFILCSCIPLKVSSEVQFVSQQYSLSVENMIYNYTSKQTLARVMKLLTILVALNRDLNLTRCLSYGVVLYYNYIFIPCNLTTGSPRPLCSDACYYYRDTCPFEYYGILEHAKLINLPVTDNCENTFSLLSALFGYVHLNSSKAFENDCFDFRGMFANKFVYVGMYKCVCIL